MSWNVSHVREEFPTISQSVHGRPLVYFDNAATTQKPRRVIEATSDFYERYNANVHRGATEAINLVAHSFGQRLVSAGGQIVLTTLEHLSNSVLWQLLCERTCATASSPITRNSPASAMSSALASHRSWI